MRTVFAALTLGLTLSGCALIKPEPWAAQIFTPSKQSINTACDRGIQGGQKVFTFGRVNFTPKTGTLNFKTRLSVVNSLCFLLGEFGKKDLDRLSSVASTQVYIEDASVKRELITVDISLEHDGQELIRLKTSSTETEEADKTWFNFERLSEVQQAALETTNSLTIIVKRGTNEEERYAVNPANLPGL
jgi:hypothetical protein